jgi:hypothetical protein
MLLSATRLDHAHTETMKALLQNRKTLGNSFTDDLLSPPIQPYYRPQIAAHCWNKYSPTSHVSGRYPAGNVNPSVSAVGRFLPLVFRTTYVTDGQRLTVNLGSDALRSRT